MTTGTVLNPDGTSSSKTIKDYKSPTANPASPYAQGDFKKGGSVMKGKMLRNAKGSRRSL